MGTLKNIIGVSVTSSFDERNEAQKRYRELWKKIEHLVRSINNK